MFVCEKNSSCCNYQYADRLDQIDEEFRNCGNLIEVQKVRHAHWSTKRTNVHDGETYCSDCEYETEHRTAYCPNCGAKMDGKDK